MFEDSETQEYTSVRTAIKSSAPSSSSSQPRYVCRPLGHFIAQGDYVAASAILRELREQEMPIRNRIVYARVARLAVRLTVRSADEPTESALDPATVLRDWLAVIPPRPAEPLRRTKAMARSSAAYQVTQVQQLGGHLMRSSRVGPELVVHYALGAAEKGYGRDIHAHITPHLSRLLPPLEFAHFLQQFLRAMNRHKVPESRRWVARRVIQTMWGIAIRGACNAGRGEDGHELLMLAHSVGLLPNAFTYGYLQTWLTHHGKPEEAERVQSLQRAVLAFRGGPPVDEKCHIRGRAKPLFPNSDSRRRDQVGPETTQARAALPDTRPTTTRPSQPARRPRTNSFSRGHTVTSNYRLALRFLHKGDRSDGIHRATSLVPFFDTLPKACSARVVRRLYSRAWHFSARVLSIVIHAHILHHMKHRRYPAALSLFLRYFHPIGVPPATSTFAAPRHHGEPHTFVIPDKFFPSPVLVALVWSAVARAVNTRDDFRLLYEQLKQLAAQTQQHGLNADGAITATHFQQFLKPPRTLRGPESVHVHARSVYEDMRALGVPPSWRTCVAVAQAHIVELDGDSARTFFDEALALCADGLRAARREGNRAAQTRWIRESARAHAEIIGTLTDRGLIPQARELAKKLSESGYRRGTDAFVDSAVARLEKRVQAAGDQILDPRAQSFRFQAL